MTRRGGRDRRTQTNTGLGRSKVGPQTPYERELMLARWAAMEQRGRELIPMPPHTEGGEPR